PEISPEEQTEKALARRRHLAVVSYFVVAGIFAVLAYQNSRMSEAEVAHLKATSSVGSIPAKESALARNLPVATLDPRCAQRDLEVWSRIEAIGEQRLLPAETVANASMQILDARSTCANGHVREAMNSYDGIEMRLDNAIIHEAR